MQASKLNLDAATAHTHMNEPHREPGGLTTLNVRNPGSMPNSQPLAPACSTLCGLKGSSVYAWHTSGLQRRRKGLNCAGGSGGAVR